MAEEIEDDVRKALVRQALEQDPANRVAHDWLRDAGPDAVRQVRDELAKKLELLNQYVTQ